MQMTKGEKKDEDESYSPFQSLQKAAVLQECRCFNDREIVPRKCIQILTKILWLLAQGAPPCRVKALCASAAMRVCRTGWSAACGWL